LTLPNRDASLFVKKTHKYGGIAALGDSVAVLVTLQIAVICTRKAFLAPRCNFKAWALP
jgi:hypothetical protein